MKFQNFIGIDISKDSLDLALITPEAVLIEVKCENNQEIILKTLHQLVEENNIEKQTLLICAEHTGHFGNKLIEVCLENDLSLWMENAYNILHSQGLTRGKNDQVDARRIAEYANRYHDKAIIYQPDKESVQLLKRLSTDRNLIVKDLAKYKGQLKQEKGFFDQKYFTQKKKRLEFLIKSNKKILLEIEQQIESIIELDSELKNSFDIITSIDGVGKQTALATIIATGNFTKFNNPRKFSCHAGCAPFSYQSGTSRFSKNKVSHRANKELKKMFHMAAISSLRVKGEMKKYYDRKIEEGKNAMTVINAIRSKLIHRIFALIKQNRKYDKSYSISLA